MSYHGYTLQKYDEKITEEDKLTDEIIKVLEEIEEKYPDVLPDDEDICFNIGLEIVENDYNPIDYMEDWIEKHNKEQ